jgi:hypothetical protein
MSLHGAVSGFSPDTRACLTLSVDRRQEVSPRIVCPPEECGKTALACPAVVRGAGLRVITTAGTTFVHVETPICGDRHAPVLRGRVIFLEVAVVPRVAMREQQRISKWVRRGLPGWKVRKFAMVAGVPDNERMVTVPGDVVARSDDSDSSDLPCTRECTVPG